MDEAAGIIKSLFRNERTDIAGKHDTVREAPLSPKPVQQSIALLIGGGGEKVTLRIVAKHADEWNTWGLPDLITKKSRILDAYCHQIGRDPATIARSAVAMLVLSDDPAKVERIVSTGQPTIGGSAESVRAIIDDYSRAGVNEVIIPDFNLGRTVEAKKESMDRFMTEVVAAVRV